MDTRHLRAFLRIAETGSISRAAESLGIAQPSLSQQLLRLEDEAGSPLFRRTPRGVTLTEAGRVFEAHARSLLLASDQAIEDVRRFRGEASGQVRLAVPFSVSRVAGLALIEAHRRTAPQVGFRLVEASTGQIRGWLEDGKIDLGVLNHFGPLSHLAMQSLVREELFLVGPPGLAATVPPEALAGLPLVLPGLPHGLRLVIDQEAARAGARLDVAVELDALAHVGGLVAGGGLHAIMPRSAVADDLAARRISLARIGAAGWHRTLALVRNPAQLVTHASLACEAIVRETFAALIGAGAWLAEPEAALHATAMKHGD